MSTFNVIARRSEATTKRRRGAVATQSPHNDIIPIENNYV